MNGIILVNKPKGITSREVVNKLSKKFKVKKIGHNGTLDPLATGVLVVCLGKYTKLNNLLTSANKTYIATVKLGFETDTLDSEGKIIFKKESNMDLSKLKQALKHFETTYNQEVPKYSAVKVNGKRLYEYARNNEEITLPKKDVTINKIKLLNFNQSEFTFFCDVSKGTYIRSLIRDICHYLNEYGTMTDLIRTSQGDFKLENASTLEEINKDQYQILKIKDIKKIPTVIVDDQIKTKILNGVKLNYNYDEVLFLDKNETELAIYKKKNNELRLYVMLFNK